MTDFQKVEGMFSEILGKPSSNLLPNECAEVKDFIDVGEYGIALETLVSIYVEENKLPDENVKAIIDALAKEMSMDPLELPHHGHWEFR